MEVVKQTNWVNWSADDIFEFIMDLDSDEKIKVVRGLLEDWPDLEIDAMELIDELRYDLIFLDRSSEPQEQTRSILERFCQTQIKLTYNFISSLESKHSETFSGNTLLPKTKKMKRTKEQTKGMAILLCVIFSLSISASAQQEVSSEIQKENDKFRSAFLSNNMDAISDKYTDEAILMPPNSEPLLGPEAITAVWNATQGMGVSDLVFKTDIAEMYGNVAIEQGKYKLFAGENVIIDQGKYIVIWEKHNGKWLIKKDIWNTSNPPAPKDNDK